MQWFFDRVAVGNGQASCSLCASGALHVESSCHLFCRVSFLCRWVVMRDIGYASAPNREFLRWPSWSAQTRAIRCACPCVHVLSRVPGGGSKGDGGRHVSACMFATWTGPCLPRARRQPVFVRRARPCRSRKDWQEHAADLGRVSGYASGATLRRQGVLRAWLVPNVVAVGVGGRGARCCCSRWCGHRLGCC